MNTTLRVSSQVADLACAIQQIPSPTFSEGERASWLREKFTAEGLQEVEIDPTGNLFGRVPGQASNHPLVVSAHLDTVFPRQTDLSLKKIPGQIYGPGIGDNSLGLAGLFGLLWMLRETNTQLPGDLWLVANVCEEGLGDLKGMRAVVQRFGRAPIAYLILEGMGLGEVFHRGLGVRRYRITIRTAGGHSWIDYGQPSAIHQMASLISQLTALPLPSDPRTSLNVGVIAGGTSINTIAAEAHLELDLRSESVETLAWLARQVEDLVHKANRNGVECEAGVIGQRPAGEIPANHPLVTLSRSVLQELGISSRLGIGSTDANIPLNQGLPAVCIGLTHGGGAHTLDEFIRTRPLSKGIDQLFRIATRVWETHAENARG